MNNSSDDRNEAGVRDKLSQTMRIDIPPETALRDHRRVVTKRALDLKETKAQVPRQATAPVIGGRDFQELFDNVYDAAIVTDMDGRIVDANVRATAFLRHTADELRSLNILNIISGAEASLMDTIRTNLVERFILIEACYCARKDGTSFPAEIAVNELELSKRNYLCFFVRDITLRRQAEEQLRVKDSAIQNSHSGIALTDLQGMIQYANTAVCTMWRYKDHDELTGKDIRGLWRQDTGGEDPVRSIIVQERAWMHETVAVRKDSSEFGVQIVAALSRDTDGKPVGMMFSFVDISDRMRAEEAIREAERRRVMLESLGAACHHLGQPATVLLANLGIMEHKVGGNNDELQNLVTSCLKAAETLAEVLHKLNATNEYRTTPYLEDMPGETVGNRILDI